MAAPPTKSQLELIDAADARHHLIFPAGTGIATLMAKVVDKKSAAFIQQPSAPALFLSMAYKAHRASKKAESGIKFTDELMGSGLQDGGTFDFFELRMQHVIFSYGALEAYANESIPDPFTWPTTNSRGESVTLNRDETERRVSLDEKLEHILTTVFGKASIKGGPLWNKFKTLKGLRDRLIHLKHFDSRAKPDAEDNSVWADLYASRGTDFTMQAHEIITYFNGAARTWARKFPFEELAKRAESSALRADRNRGKRARRESKK